MNGANLGGKRYSDPDVLALVEAGGGLQDPPALVLTQARKLNALYRRFDVSGDSPIQRLKHLASLRGLTVEPMNVEHRNGERRDAVIIFNSTKTGKTGHILYNPDRPFGRVAFSIAHEIAHTFFPSSSQGVRFREMSASDSREANELERLCDLAASELLMPKDEFQAAVGSQWTINLVPKLSDRFGSSFEATVFRLASAYPGVAAGGSLRFRRTKGDERKLRIAVEQASLFSPRDRAVPNISSPKYRRQSLFTSEDFPPSKLIPWNKSFDEESIAYRAMTSVVAGNEALPNATGEVGLLEVVRAPYQRAEADSERCDVLFFWREAH